jgi:hypothetical protein
MNGNRSDDLIRKEKLGRGGGEKKKKRDSYAFLICDTSSVLVFRLIFKNIQILLRLLFFRCFSLCSQAVSNCQLVSIVSVSQ